MWGAKFGQGEFERVESGLRERLKWVCSVVHWETRQQLDSPKQQNTTYSNTKLQASLDNTVCIEHGTSNQDHNKLT